EGVCRAEIDREVGIEDVDHLVPAALRDGGPVDLHQGVKIVAELEIDAEHLRHVVGGNEEAGQNRRRPVVYGNRLGEADVVPRNWKIAVVEHGPACPHLKISHGPWAASFVNDCQRIASAARMLGNISAATEKSLKNH